MQYAEILFQQKVGLDKETLTYSVPENLKIQIGDLVKVPLRKNFTTGLVFEIHNKKPAFKTLPIVEKCFEEPILSQNQIALLKWISSYYFCPIFKVLKYFVPKRIFAGRPIKSRKKENVVLEDNSSPKFTTNEEKTLTDSQKSVIQEILSNKAKSYLLRGVTGSGKTEIYTKLAEHFLAQKKQVLILVPEISLTPQIINYFEKSLQIPATVIHSKLSLGERNLSWMNIWQNKSKLIIGSRSAIFAPFQNLGMIIIDEEHENSYKQDSSPRYSVHSIIEQMQKLFPDLLAVFGSATPSIEIQKKLEEKTLILHERIGQVSMPEIEIIDLRIEFQKRNYSIFSDRLKELLQEMLDKKEQAILFLNRRGTASSVVCRDCGQSLKCKNCELPMTYHTYKTDGPKLICHHCGAFENPPDLCPNCQSHNIKFLGIGTQRIEADLQKEFPAAKILRADKDTTGNKHGFEEIYNKFKNHEADFLVGTQMIAKGLDIPSVNLVGVILADIGLNIPDFKSTERNFQLLTQVAGRSGRKSGSGKVVIQTYNPENQSLFYAKTHDYENFYKYELTQRKILTNPPFSHLAKITVQNKSLQKCKTQTEEIEKVLKEQIKNPPLKDSIEINSYPAFISKLKGKYQYIILLKDKTNTNLIHEILVKLPKEVIIAANVKIDIDPISTT